MIKPTIPTNEKERLNTLKSYEILDSEDEAIFDAITRLAASICDVPISLISLIDENRQWFKSRQGLGATETPRDVSFCGHAINQSEIFYIEDATKDERFKDNPLVTGAPNVIFYAGKPLIDNRGFAIGTLCVIDSKPRKLTPLQLEQLKLLGEQAIFLIQTRIEMKKKDETHALLRKISENLPGFIYTYQLRSDGSSCFPFSSRQIEDIYEVKSQEVKFDASAVFTRIHPEDKGHVAKTITESAQSMSVWTCDYRVILPTLGEKWLRGHANPEKIADGSILWHGYISDITELKKQEEIVINNSKMASLGEMASGVAHEVNNPLAIIQSTAQLISMSLESQNYKPEDLIKSFNTISKTTDRISKIIRGLKFFASSSHDDHFKNESLMGIIEETSSLTQEKFKINNVDFTVKYPESITELKIDCRAVEISQVVLNLLNNAFDAIEPMSKKWIRIDVEDRNDFIIMSIVDCGHGISEEVAAKILTPFYTTKAAGKGTGLGLSISQRIIEGHKGKFWIDTKSANTRFVIELPKVQIIN